MTISLIALVVISIAKRSMKANKIHDELESIWLSVRYKKQLCKMKISSPPQHHRQTDTILR